MPGGPGCPGGPGGPCTFHERGVLFDGHCAGSATTRSNPAGFTQTLMTWADAASGTARSATMSATILGTGSETELRPIPLSDQGGGEELRCVDDPIALIQEGGIGARRSRV